MEMFAVVHEIRVKPSSNDLAAVPRHALKNEAHRQLLFNASRTLPGWLIGSVTSNEESVTNCLHAPWGISRLVQACGAIVVAAPDATESRWRQRRLHVAVGAALRPQSPIIGIGLSYFDVHDACVTAGTHRARFG